MKQILSIIVLILITLTPVLAIQEGTGAASAVIDNHFMVLERPAGSNTFSIGTYRGSDFSTEFKKNEIITFKFGDVISFAQVKCNAASFVMEQYDMQGKFLSSWKSGNWALARGESKSYSGSVSKDATTPGNFVVVGYLWCFDSDWKSNNPELTSAKISQGQEQHKAVYSVVEGTQCLPDGRLSDPYCADGKVVRNIRKSCTQKIEVIQQCKTGTEYCSVDSCIPSGSGGTAPGEPKPVVCGTTGCQPPLPDGVPVVKASTPLYKQPAVYIFALAIIGIIYVAKTGKKRRKR